MISLKQGSELIKIARAAIEGNKPNIKGFEEKRGLFVTLNSYPSLELRGCIGFSQPVFAIKEAIVEAAKAAAFHDPRFPPLDKSEKVVIEVSVLTLPEEIRVKDAKYFPKHVKIGEDGLIVECGGRTGLLLPQMFPEWNATPEKALDMTCEKAGLSPESWKTGRCKFYKFRAQIFKEEKPNGNVTEEKQ